MNQEEQAKKMGQLIAKCWADEGFKSKMIADPAATMRAEGFELPDGVSYVAHENTEQVVHLVIPPRPTDLSDEALGQVVGGMMCVRGCDSGTWIGPKPDPPKPKPKPDPMNTHMPGPWPQP